VSAWFLAEFDAEPDQFGHAFWSLGNDSADGFFIAEADSGIERIGDVLVK
jgi:hypothetical protein